MDFVSLIAAVFVKLFCDEDNKNKPVTLLYFSTNDEAAIIAMFYQEDNMILRNGDILTDNFLDAVKKLLRATMPVKVSFKLAQSVKIISSNYDEAFAQRTNLIKQYGKDNGAGGFDVRLSSKEDQEKFFSELNDLYQIEFDIPLEAKIDLTKVNFPDDIQMSATELFSLQSIANIDDEPPPAKAEEPAKADAPPAA